MSDRFYRTTLNPPNDKPSLPMEYSPVTGPLNPFANTASFELAQRMVKPLAASDLVPSQFRNNPANCLIALNMANRMQADPFMVMQSVYVVHGKPSFSSKFLIALVNSSGMLKSNLAFMMVGTPGKDDHGCFCRGVARDGMELVGPTVTITMAKAEGWYGKNGSKWQTMPELMLRYRAASFWSSLYAPELTLGIRATEELVDLGDADVVADVGGLNTLNETLAEKAGHLDALATEPPDTEPAPDLTGGWPRLMNAGTDEKEWIDATGQEYDPELHAWSDANKAPSVTKIGHFRKRRGVKVTETPKPTTTPTTETTQAETPATDTTPPQEPETPENGPGAPEPEYSPTLKSMLLAVDAAEDAAAVERVANHPFAKELSDRESEVLAKRCQEKGAELAQK